MEPIPVACLWVESCHYYGFHRQGCSPFPVPPSGPCWYCWPMPSLGQTTPCAWGPSGALGLIATYAHGYGGICTYNMIRACLVLFTCILVIPSIDLLLRCLLVMEKLARLTCCNMSMCFWDSDEKSMDKCKAFAKPTQVLLSLLRKGQYCQDELMEFLVADGSFLVAGPLPHLL